MLAVDRYRSWLPYVCGLAGLIVACALRLFFDSALEDHLTFTLFLLSVALVGWLGGIWPALFTAAMSCFVEAYFFASSGPEQAINRRDQVISLLIFMLISVVIGMLAENVRRALQRAKMAERAKDTFIATLAHELRSPLSVISYANELNRISRPGENNNEIDIIQRQVQQLDFMIQDLLDVSRVARGQLRIEPQRVEAAALVRGAVEKARPVIQSHEHQLTIDVEPDSTPLWVDPVRIEQVLANLLINAAKYTPDGGRLVLRMRREDDSAVFTVRDNGIGIAEDLLPRVFELFVQADSSSTNSNGGLGIGLALVRKVVELHGGSVTAFSAGPNRGSEFSVSLPLAQMAPPKPQLVEA